MSANFYDLLKCAATGQASPSMTYYDRMRASTLTGGAVQTLTGIPPLSFKSDGTPLISWSMKGNGSQIGTPTPDNPVMPEFVGVRTANLYDVDGKNTANGYVDNQKLNSDGSIATWGSAEISEYIPIVGNASYSFNGVGSYNSPAYCFYDADKQYISGNNYRGLQRITFVAPSNAKYFRFTHIKTATNAMCNAGETVLPYEPYGWAEKITCAGQTVPVYLGQVQTVRKVKKLVFDGTENYTTGSAIGQIRTPITRAVNSLGCCTHYILKASYGGAFPYIRITNNVLWFELSPTGYETKEEALADFKSFLQQQYAAGTPVTVWYVLAEPETGIINEPLAKIGDYADELHSTDAAVTIPTAKGQNTLTVGTDLQPSEMMIVYQN